MRTTIDGAGRVVVPKTYRERLGLRPGQEVQFDETDVGLLLTPVAPEPRILETPEGPVIVPEAVESEGVALTDDAVRALLEAGRR